MNSAAPETPSPRLSLSTLSPLLLTLAHAAAGGALLSWADHLVHAQPVDPSSPFAKLAEVIRDGYWLQLTGCGIAFLIVGGMEALAALAGGWASHWPRILLYLSAAASLVVAANAWSAF